MRSPINDDLVVTSPYGYRIHPVTRARSFHNGVDLRANDGTPIYASFDGVVSWNEHPTGGLQLVIVHPGGLRFGFAHLSSISKDLHQGQLVKEGDLLAYSGHTGRVTGPHIHFTASVLKDGIKELFNPTLLQFT